MLSLKKKKIKFGSEMNAKVNKKFSDYQLYSDCTRNRKQVQGLIEL